jgi:hypothetical protein
MYKLLKDVHLQYNICILKSSSVLLVMILRIPVDALII